MVACTLFFSIREVDDFLDRNQALFLYEAHLFFFPNSMPEGIPDAGDQDRYPGIFDADYIVEHPSDEMAHSPEEYPFLSEEVRAELRRLANPEMTSDDAFDLVRELNDRYGVHRTPEGRYSVLHFFNPLQTTDGVALDVWIKVFKDMGDALSFGIGRLPDISGAGDIADNPESQATHSLEKYSFLSDLSEKIREKLRKLEHFFSPDSTMPEDIRDAEDWYPSISDAGDIADNPDNPTVHSLEEYPFLSEEVRAELRKLADPGMTSDDAFDLIRELNDRYGVQGTPEGPYNVLNVEIPPTVDGDFFDVQVKVYEDMDNALSFSRP
jgi:hypothetical protein